MDYNNKLFQVTMILLMVIILFSSVVKASEQVGVLDFTGNVALEFREAAATRMTRILIDLQRFNVIDRANIDQILSEMHFQMTGLVDMDTAVEAGKLLGINQAFIGSIDHLTSSRDSSGYRAETRITIKVFDVQTATVLHIIETSGAAADTNRTNAQHKAIENAMGESFISQLRERFAITSIITRVDGRVVDIIGGQDMGMKEGYRYRIIRLDEPGMAFDDSFAREIGLLQIVDVTATRSRGRVIYANEQVMPNDIALEVPYNTRGLFDIRVKTLGYNLNQGLMTGMAPLAEIAYLTERPFGYSWGGYLGLSFLKGILLFNLGIEGSYEVPITPGQLYLTVRGGGGFYGGTQDHYQYRHYQGGSSNASSFYVNGVGGIKYYVNYDKGIRFNLGAGGIFGGSLNSWENDRGHNVNDYVEHYSVNISGFSIMASLSFPLGSSDMLSSLDFPSLNF